MCLIVFSYNSHPHYPLILLANRDEFYQRPTKTASWWDDFPHIIGGRDLKENGSWLAMTRHGEFAAITNFRDPFNIKKDVPSRGQLVLNFLNSDGTIHEFNKTLEENGATYNGFNLLYGDMDQIYYYSNQTNQVTSITAGIHGLSNALLNEPWPKVEKAKSKLADLSNGSNQFDLEKAVLFMNDTELALDDQLPNTGIGIEKERLLSPMHINIDGYGTRCSTIITIDNDSNVTFKEVSYLPKNEFVSSFKLSKIVKQ